MDTGNYQYSQYESAAEYDTRVNSYSSTQPSGMMSQQTGMVSQQSGLMTQQAGMTSQQYGMSRPSGMVSQQSGMMSQDSSSMSQQSNMWGMPQQSDGMLPQSQNSWTPQGGTMSQAGSSSMGQQSNNYSMTQAGNYGSSMSHTSGNYGSSNYSAPTQNFQNQSGMQFGNMMNQQISDYPSFQQQVGNNSTYGEQGSNYQGGQRNSGYQGNNSSTYQQGRSEESFQQSDQTFSYQQGNQSSSYQGNQNSSYQHSNQNPPYQHGNQHPSYQGNHNSNYQGNQNSSYQQGYQNSTYQQAYPNAAYKQGNSYYNQKDSSGAMNQQGRRPYQPKAPAMNDQLDEFYASIDGNTDESHHWGPDNTGYPPQSGYMTSSTPQSTNSQHNSGWKPYKTGGQIGTGMSGFNKGSMSQTLKKSDRPPAMCKPDKYSTHHLSSSQKVMDEYVDEDTDYCKLCNVYFTSAPMYAFHVRGVSHSQRMLAVNAGRDRKAAETPYIVSGRNFTQTKPQDIAILPVRDENQQKTVVLDASGGSFCELCGIYLNHEKMLWKHYSGKKHQKALKAVQEGKIVPTKKMYSEGNDPNIERAIELLETPVPEENMSVLNFSFDPVPQDEPIVGLSFLVETMPNNEQKVECELCCTSSNLFNMVQHVIGIRHRMRYLKIRDPERYATLNTTMRKPARAELVRQMCVHLERSEGRGVARYVGPPRETFIQEHGRPVRENTPPPPPQRERRREQHEARSGPEVWLAIENLKRTLLEDFQKRNIDPDTATKMLNSRLNLLDEYERRGVPFEHAKARVLEDEERFNLLLEFERQVLPFEESEKRIDRRLDLMRTYEQNGYSTDEARSKALDEEVIYDFKFEFSQMGLRRGQAQRMAEKRLWMLEHLHLQGLPPEKASKKVITIEKDLKRCIRRMLDDDRKRRGSREPQTAQWLKGGEDLEKFVAGSCRELGLTKEQTEAHVNVALGSFDKYKKQKIHPDEAVGRVILDDLPIPTEPVPVTDPENDPGCLVDVMKRVEQFKSKFGTVSKAAAGDNKESKKEDTPVVDVKGKLADFDEESHKEMQNLVSDMLTKKIPAEQAKRRLQTLHKEHENIRKSLFPGLKSDGVQTSSKTLGEPDKKAASKQKQMEQPSSTNESGPKEEHSMKQKLAASKELREEPTVKQDSTVSKGASGGGQVKEKANAETEKGQDKKASEEKAKSVKGQDKKASEEKAKSEYTEKNKAAEISRKRSAKTADGRWNASLEMFFLQYNLGDMPQSNKGKNIGQERYSPSDLSPKHSTSGSQGQSGRHRRRSRSPLKKEVERDDRKNLGSPKWGAGLTSSSGVSVEGRRRPTSPRQSQRSGERELARRSPGRRSPGRYSRRSPASRRSPLRRSPPRRSPPRGHGIFLERRRSPPRHDDHDRFSPRSRRSRHSPLGGRHMSPYEDEFYPPQMHDMYESSRDGRRPRESRDGRYMSPPRDFEPGYEDGVWPDVDNPWD